MSQFGLLLFRANSLIVCRWTKTTAKRSTTKNLNSDAHLFRRNSIFAIYFSLNRHRCWRSIFIIYFLIFIRWPPVCTWFHFRFCAEPIFVLFNGIDLRTHKASKKQTERNSPSERLKRQISTEKKYIKKKEKRRSQININNNLFFSFFFSFGYGKFRRLGRFAQCVCVLFRSVAHRNLKSKEFIRISVAAPAASFSIHWLRRRRKKKYIDQVRGKRILHTFDYIRLPDKIGNRKCNQK